MSTIIGFIKGFKYVVMFPYLAWYDILIVITYEFVSL